MPNEELNSVEDSKRRSLRRIVIPVIATFIVVVIVAYRLERQESSPTDVTQSAHFQEALIEINDIGEAVQEIYERIGLADSQVTVADELFLLRSLAFFKRINEHRVFSGHPKLLAHAAIQQGHVSRLLDRNNDAEFSFRQSIRWLEDLAQHDRDSNTLIGISYTSNSLSCLLGEKGNFDEAAKFARKAIETAQEASTGPGDRDSLLQLAIGYRNLAIASQMMGQDGTGAASDSTKMFAELYGSASRLPRYEQLSILGSLVDSYQIQAVLYDQVHDDNAAREACIQSLHEFQRFKSMCETLLERDNINIRLRRVAAVEHQLKRNLESGQDDQTAHRSPTEPIGVPYAKFVLLERLEGRALHPDQLLRGFVAGEFQEQDAIALVWPEDVPPVRSAIVEVIGSLYPHVQVVLLVQSSLSQAQVTEYLKRADIPPEEITFVVAQTETIWLRDFGPLGVDNSDGSRLFVDAKYNVFGGERRFLDDHVPMVFGQYFETPTLRTPIFLEWGGVAFNGSGLAIVSTELLESNRHIGFDEQQVTQAVKRLTGATQVVYLEPLEGEPTGHVDWFMTFTSPDTLVLGDYTGVGDTKNAQLLDRHARKLEGMPTDSGPLKVVRIPMPPRCREWFGGTYTNVVFANGVLLVPSWPKSAPQELEQRALDVYRRLLPDWKIISIDSQSLGILEGSFHCVTMNISSSPRSTGEISRGAE